MERFYKDNYPLKKQSVSLKTINGRILKFQMYPVAHIGITCYNIIIDKIPINLAWLLRGCLSYTTTSDVIIALLNIPLTDAMMDDLDNLGQGVRDAVRNMICQNIHQ